MKKFLSIAVSILLLITAVLVYHLTVHSENRDQLPLHQTPQTYYLTNEDDFLTMPTVTLYENGNARLSQPPISSMALFTMGRYHVNGDELTVTLDENIRVTFLISDGGDTLTLKSTNLGFTKIGTMYQYRSKTEASGEYSPVDGDALTLEKVRELANKGPALTLADFEGYAYTAIGPNDRVFDVEGDYTLTVVCDGNGNINCTIERNTNGESFPLSLNGSTGLVFDDFLGIADIPKYDTKKWLDFLHDDELPWDQSIDLSLPEFPEVTFTWTSEKITAGEKELIFGMPVWNVYLADLTNDGKPEICATVSFGSGIVDTRVVVYDYVKDQEYLLADRMVYDYCLSMQDGQLMVTQMDYNNRKPLATAQLQLVNGEIRRFGNPRP